MAMMASPTFDVIKHHTFLYSPAPQDIVTYADSYSTLDLPLGGPYLQVYIGQKQVLLQLIPHLYKPDYHNSELSDFI